jgi:hypothetical protein
VRSTGGPRELLCAGEESQDDTADLIAATLPPGCLVQRRRDGALLGSWASSLGRTPGNGAQPYQPQGRIGRAAARDGRSLTCDGLTARRRSCRRPRAAGIVFGHASDWPSRRRRNPSLSPRRSWSVGPRQQGREVVVVDNRRALTRIATNAAPILLERCVGLRIAVQAAIWETDVRLRLILDRATSVDR